MKIQIGDHGFYELVEVTEPVVFQTSGGEAFKFDVVDGILNVKGLAEGYKLKVTENVVLDLPRAPAKEQPEE